MDRPICWAALDLGDLSAFSVPRAGWMQLQPIEPFEVRDAALLIPPAVPL
jgi:hypothetical protein